MSAAAVIVIRIKRIFSFLRERQAISAESAVAESQVPYSDRRYFRRLVSRGVIKRVGDRCYLDETLAELYFRERRKRAFIFLVISALAFGVCWLIWGMKKMTGPPQRRQDVLQSLRTETFRETTFSGMDALVAFIPKGQDIPPEIKRTVDDAGAGRWFPHEGGWKVVCPYTGQDFNPDLFTIQKGGWEHEHCDGCQGTISVGDSCWVAETQDECFIICGNCRTKLEAKGE